MSAFSRLRVPQPAREDGGDDILDLIDAGAQALRSGQTALPPGEPQQSGGMLLSPTMTLYDSMSATQLLDPRVDTGMVSEAEKTQPEFQPDRSLPAETVVWVMDELARREMTFYAGHGLAQTVYSCLYVTHFDRFPLAGQVTGLHEPELLRLVLRAYILSTMKTCDIVWNEMIRGNLKEGEDVNTDKAGVWLAEDLSPDDVFLELDAAYDWLMRWRDRDQQYWRDSLLDRLRLRMELLYPLCLVYEPTSPLPAEPAFDTVPQRIADARDALTSLLLRRRATASPEADGVFDPTISRRLPCAIAFRPIDLLSRDQAFADMQDMLSDICSAVLIAQQDSWRAWEEGFLQLARQPIQMAPFGRSLCQTMFCAEGKVARTRKVSWLARVYMAEVADWTNTDFDDLLASCEYDDRIRLRRDLDGFLDALSGRLVSFVGILGSNRPRQKRQLARALVDWNRFLQSAGDIVHKLADLSAERSVRTLYWSVERIQGLMLLEALFAGFELALYDDVEHRLHYWVAGRCLDRQLSTLSALIDHARPGAARAGLEDERLLLSGLRQLCSASAVLIKLARSNDQPPDPDNEYWPLRFETRFEWIPERFGLSSASTAWSTFCEDAAAQVDELELRLGATRALEGARTCFADLLSRPPRGGPAGDAPREWLDSLHATTSQNLAALASGRLHIEMRWRHPWFPSLAVSDEADV